MSDEQISVFETYNITEIGNDNPEIPDIIAAAVQRPYGPRLKLKLQFTIAYDFEVYIDPIFVKQMLHMYKDNIISIEIPIKHGDYDFLLEPDFDFEQLESVHLYCILDENESDILTKELCGSFISRYANKLEHIGIEDLNIQENTEEFKASPLTKLTSLTFESMDNASSLGLMKSVKFDNLTELNLSFINLSSSEINDLEIKNLSVLLLDQVRDDFALAILKSNMNTLVKLKLSYLAMNNLVHGEIKFSILESLEICDMEQNIALSIIQAAKETLEELAISDINHSIELGIPSEFKFLKLKTLKLDGCYPSIDSKFVLALINAGKETISTIYKKKEEICETLLNFLKNLSSVYQHM